MLSDLPELTPTPGQGALAPAIIESPNPALADAQATIDTGQSQLLDLSRKSTEAALNRSQAANAAAQATKDYNQRQKLDLDYQATAVSLNITQAAATQNAITEQTKIARDATAAAQSSEATATHSAYLINVTQTAQAQAVLDAQVAQTAQAVSALTAYPLTQTVQAQVMLNVQSTATAQANATLTAYPLTATPYAVTQAALLMQEYDREQQTFVDRVVAPLIPIVLSIDLLLVILFIILAYRGLLPVRWIRRLGTPHANVNRPPMILIDGVITNHHSRLQPTNPSEQKQSNRPQPPGENAVHVEVVNAAELPVVHWIADVERQLDAKG